MSSDTKWIIGTGISLAGVLLLAMLAQFSSLNNRIDDLASRIDDLEERFASRIDDLGSRIDDLEGRFESRIDDLQSVVRRMEERLRLVEIGLAEVKALIAGDGGNPAGAAEQ